MSEKKEKGDKMDVLHGLVHLGIPEQPVKQPQTIAESDADANVESKEYAGEKTETEIEAKAKSEAVEEDVPMKETEKPMSGKKRRKGQGQAGDYKDVYFARIDFSDRQPLYITRDTHETLMRIVSVVGGRKATISSYVENIILRHLENYREEINRLYDDHYIRPV